MARRHDFRVILFCCSTEKHTGSGHETSEGLTQEQQEVRIEGIKKEQGTVGGQIRIKKEVRGRLLANDRYTSLILQKSCFNKSGTEGQKN